MMLLFLSYFFSIVTEAFNLHLYVSNLKMGRRNVQNQMPVDQYRRYIGAVYFIIFFQLTFNVLIMFQESMRSRRKIELLESKKSELMSSAREDLHGK